ncbi:Transcription and mRNA export factor eny2 [Sorochytrium milnesiophthora]
MDAERIELNRRLAETGEKERLKATLLLKLDECGWRDKVRKIVEAQILSKGVENVSVDGLLQSVLPDAQAAVPENVRRELMKDLSDWLDKN